MISTLVRNLQQSDDLKRWIIVFQQKIAKIVSSNSNHPDLVMVVALDFPDSLKIAGLVAISSSSSIYDRFNSLVSEQLEIQAHNKAVLDQSYS